MKSVFIIIFLAVSLSGCDPIGTTEREQKDSKITMLLEENKYLKNYSTDLEKRLSTEFKDQKDVDFAFNCGYFFDICPGKSTERGRELIKKGFTPSNLGQFSFVLASKFVALFAALLGVFFGAWLSILWAMRINKKAEEAREMIQLAGEKVKEADEKAEQIISEGRVKFKKEAEALELKLKKMEAKLFLDAEIQSSHEKRLSCLREDIKKAEEALTLHKQVKDALSGF